MEPLKAVTLLKGIIRFFTFGISEYFNLLFPIPINDCYRYLQLSTSLAKRKIRFDISVIR